MSRDILPFDTEPEDEDEVQKVEPFDNHPNYEECPWCGYDRMVVTGHTVAGVYAGTCNNPQCEFLEEL